jgi:Pyruvate/2-oxoacid:ferredoxin oxidoreductase delta subunit
MRTAHPTEAASLVSTCQVCGVSMSTKFNLYRHIETSHRAFMETVQLQSATTPNIPVESLSTAAAIVDKVTSQSEEKLRKSLGPKKLISQKEDLKRSQNVEDGSHLECTRCQIHLATEELYRRHQAKHQFMAQKHANKKRKINAASDKDSQPENVAGQHECPQCQQQCTTDSALTQHQMMEHKTPTWHMCHLCADGFGNAEQLQQHISERHSGKARKYIFICELCTASSPAPDGSTPPPPQSFAVQSLLTKHLKKIHRIPRGLATSRAQAMALAAGAASIQRKTEPSVEPIEQIASSSGRSGDTVSSMAVKRLYVSGEETGYQCARCDFSTVFRPEFVKHINEQHSPKTSSAVQCKECGSCFAVAPALHRHLHIVHHVKCDINTYLRENGGILASPTSSDDGSTTVSASGSPVLSTRVLFSSNSSTSLSSRPDSISQNSQDDKSKTISLSVADSDAVEDSGVVHECTVCYRSFGTSHQLRGHMRAHGMAFIQRTKRMLASLQSATCPK